METEKKVKGKNLRWMAFLCDEFMKVGQLRYGMKNLINEDTFVGFANGKETSVWFEMCVWKWSKHLELSFPPPTLLVMQSYVITEALFEFSEIV